jgi:hypothetical protein
MDGAVMSYSLNPPNRQAMELLGLRFMGVDVGMAVDKPMKKVRAVMKPSPTKSLHVVCGQRETQNESRHPFTKRKCTMLEK